MQVAIKSRATLFQLIILFFAICIPDASASSPGRTAGGNTRYLDRLTGGEWQAHTVIVKFAPEARRHLSRHSAALPSAGAVYLRYGVHETAQMYPPRRNALNESGREFGLDRMYRIIYSTNANPIEVARELSALPGVEYAEPERIHKLAYTPNDAMLGQQYALDVMKVKEAWEITTGKREVIIGIVDTGVHWTHEDLRENVAINPGEDINGDGRFTTADINGIDDDGNGYIDDIIGIDFAGPDGSGGGAYYDNNPLPTATGNNHGTHVAGIIAAVGNNEKGIAGVAFRCRYLPVKCGTDAGGQNIIRGYDGIVYAADMGATIINCSWGGAGGYLQSEIDRIDYALAKGAVVVVAAGNSGRDEIFTPAAYPNVLAVASTGPGDRVSYFSNYATWVDVSAPGDAILSAVSSSNSAYASQSGTSMASPNCAGVLALVASHRPDLRGRALAEQVRVTSDNVDDLQSPRYQRKIGYGRVNALRALTLSLPSVRMTHYEVSDKTYGNGDGIFDRGEKLEVTMRWQNFLSTTKNAVVTLSTKSNNVTIISGEHVLGAMTAGAVSDNENSPFVIELADVESYNEQIDMFFSITDDGYDDYGGFSFIWQQTYRDHNANDITTTISNDGNIGFDDFSGVRGKGFIFRNNGSNVLFEGALMIGAKVDGEPIVVDVARNHTGNVQCTDFIGSAPVAMRTPGPVAAQEGSTEFTDENAPIGGRLGVHVSLSTWVFTEPELANAVFLRYTIRNTSDYELEDLHAGLFFDWDIGPSAMSDFSDFDSASMTAWAYDFDKTAKTFVGATVLTREKPVHFMSIANPETDANPPVFGIHNGYTKEEKWLSLSSGVWNTRILFTDISQVIANGPFTLQPGDSCIAAFALFGGLSKDDIISATPHALDKWKQLIESSTGAQPVPAAGGLEILSIAPNPLLSGNSAIAMLRISTGASGPIELRLHDVLGRVVWSQRPENMPPGAHGIALPLRGALPPGAYLLRVTGGRNTASAKLRIF